MAESEGALSKLLDFLVSKEHHLSKRAALMILLLMGVYLLDNYVGFSDFYAYDHKVEQIAKIESMLHKPDLDTTLRKQLRELENQIIERKSLFAYLPTYNSLANSQFFSKDIQPRKTESGKPIIIERDLIWHVISSGWPVFVLMLLMLIVPFFGEFNLGALVGMIIGQGFLFMIVYGLSALFLLIPILFNNPTYNYILNCFLSIGLIIGLGLVIKRYSPSK